MDSDLQTLTQTSPSLIKVLADEVVERIDHHKKISREAAILILEVLENIVRLGWALIDINKEFKGLEGGFNSFIERNLPVGRSQAYNYMQVAKRFRRDAENLGRHQEVR